VRTPITRLIVSAGLVVSSVVLSLGQATRVVVTKAGDDELRRTAYRMRLCPEQLRNARQALAAAEALVPDVAGQVYLGDLGSYLNRLDRPHAPAVLTQLLAQLADRAGQAEDWNLQERANRFEAQLIAAQAVEDFGRAMDLAAALPDPKVRYQAYMQIAQLVAR